MNRRKFLLESSLATSGLLYIPSLLHTKKNGDLVLGHNNKKYRINTDWGKLDFQRYPVKDCHEMVQDSKGRLIMLGDHTHNNILIFDNGPDRLDQAFPFSRVIEVNPATNQIVWKYQEASADNFYSSRISNAQRLPNGNTLINEGLFGRFFEVTPDGEVVWEYVNPYFEPANRPPQTQANSAFRVYRYTEAEVVRARKAT